MKVVSLDPGGYEGTYKLIGGQSSLDFINTVAWPGTDREHDWLDRRENVLDWATAAGILNEEQLQGDPIAEWLSGDLHQVREIRGALAAVLRPLARDEDPGQEEINRLNRLLQKAFKSRRIGPDSHEWEWATPTTLTELLAPVVWNAARVIAELDHSRIGECPSCEWLFYDKSRNRSRKWCDMDDCGSRAKALRYYHRTKSDA